MLRRRPPRCRILAAVSSPPCPRRAVALPDVASSPPRRHILVAVHRCSIHWLILSLTPRVMGRDKRKGKEPVVEPPKKKKTRSQKEAERAAMTTRAADDQAAGRGRPFQIHEPGARMEEQQGERVNSPPHRSFRERPRTRGGHSEHQVPSPRQPEARPRRSRATAQDHAEDREVTTAVYRMDTVVRVAEGTQLQDLTKAKVAKVKRLRWAVLMEEWKPQPEI
jgi:hypothetical protein